jgi:hypothetical protein
VNTSEQREKISRALEALLIRKLAITGLFWCVPLLAFPSSWFVALGIPEPEPLIFVRMLGAAYLALLVGYYMGMRGMARGESPAQAIHMGIASNGLACLLLVVFCTTGAGSSWGTGAQIFMWLSAAGACAMTFSLLRFRRALCPARG